MQDAKKFTMVESPLLPRSLLSPAALRYFFVLVVSSYSSVIAILFGTSSATVAGAAAAL